MQKKIQKIVHDFSSHLIYAEASELTRILFLKIEISSEWGPMASAIKKIVQKKIKL